MWGGGGMVVYGPSEVINYTNLHVYCLINAGLPSRVVSTICIPGGRLDHGNTELVAAKPSREVSEVIIALGLNNVLSGNLSAQGRTIYSQAEQLVVTVQSKYAMSRVYLVAIPNAPKVKADVLQSSNKVLSLVASKCGCVFVPASVPICDTFWNMRDKVHFTVEGFQNWIAQVTASVRSDPSFFQRKKSVPDLSDTSAFPALVPGCDFGALSAAPTPPVASFSFRDVVTKCAVNQPAIPPVHLSRHVNPVCPSVHTSRTTMQNVKRHLRPVRQSVNHSHPRMQNAPRPENPARLSARHNRITTCLSPIYTYNTFSVLACNASSVHHDERPVQLERTSVHPPPLVRAACYNTEKARPRVRSISPPVRTTCPTAEKACLSGGPPSLPVRAACYSTEKARPRVRPLSPPVRATFPTSHKAGCAFAALLYFYVSPPSLPSYFYLQ